MNEILVIDCVILGTMVGVVSESWIATGVAALIVAGLQFIAHGKNRLTENRDQ